MSKQNYYHVTAQSIPPKGFKSRKFKALVKANNPEEIKMYGNYLMKFAVDSKDHEGREIDVDYVIKCIKIIPCSIVVSVDRVKQMLQGKGGDYE